MRVYRTAFSGHATDRQGVKPKPAPRRTEGVRHASQIDPRPRCRRLARHDGSVLNCRFRIAAVLAASASPLALRLRLRECRLCRLLPEAPGADAVRLSLAHRQRLRLLIERRSPQNPGRLRGPGFSLRRNSAGGGWGRAESMN